ncbi:gypsy/ty3 retroelement polyprotein [Tanacetum coccineum]
MDYVSNDPLYFSTDHMTYTDESMSSVYGTDNRFMSLENQDMSPNPLEFSLPDIRCNSCYDNNGFESDNFMDIVLNDALYFSTDHMRYTDESMSCVYGIENGFVSLENQDMSMFNTCGLVDENQTLMKAYTKDTNVIGENMMNTQKRNHNEEMKVDNAKFATGELNRLANEEGTSNKGGSGWLYRVNQFFLLDSVADDQKVRLVSMHMFDKALNWHKQFIRKNCENVQWTVYEREVQKHFDHVFEDQMVELKNLKQVTTIQIVKLYQEQFDALMNKVELSEAYAVSLFIGGLKDEISMSVRMFKPNTLTDVYCLAKIQEATLHVLKTKQTPLLTTPKAPYTNSYANRSMTYPPKTTTTTLAIPAPPNTELTKSAYWTVVGSNSEDFELEELLLDEPVVQNFEETLVEAQLISLHALGKALIRK